MSDIVIDIDPVALQLGGLEIRWYSLFIMLAIAAGTLVAVRLAKGKGIPPMEIFTLVLWAVIAGFIGARLFHVIDHWGYFTENPLQIFRYDQGGLAQLGGITGGAIAVIVYTRIKHMPLLPLLDIAAPALLTGLIIGRIACIINGDAYGGITGLPWGFIYTNPHSFIPGNLEGIPTHPYPVYEMLWNSVVLLIIWRLGHYFRTDGLTFFSFLGFYSLGRLLLSFVRQERELIWGLQEAQLVAIFLLTLSVVMSLYLTHHSPKNAVPDTASEAG